MEPQHKLSHSWMLLSLGPQLTGSGFSSVSKSHDVFMKMLQERLAWKQALLYFSPTRVLPPKVWGVCIRSTMFLSSTSYMTEKSSALLTRNWPCPLRVPQFLYSGQAEKQCTEWKCPEWQCPECVLRANGLRGSALRSSGQTGNILRGSLLKGSVLTGYRQAMYWEAVFYQCTERQWTEGTVLTGGGQSGTVWIGRVSRINVLPVSWEAVDRKHCVDRQCTEQQWNKRQCIKKQYTDRYCIYRQCTERQCLKSSCSHESRKPCSLELETQESHTGQWGHETIQRWGCERLAILELANNAAFNPWPDLLEL